jgi:hypothetical protein
MPGSPRSASDSDNRILIRASAFRELVYYTHQEDVLKDLTRLDIVRDEIMNSNRFSLMRLDGI